MKEYDGINMDRFNEVYDYLVDQTENPEVAHSGRKRRLLSNLIDLFEYLVDEVDENPVPDAFERKGL